MSRRRRRQTDRTGFQDGHAGYNSLIAAALILSLPLITDPASVQWRSLTTSSRLCPIIHAAAARVIVHCRQTWVAKVGGRESAKSGHRKPRISVKRPINRRVVIDVTDSDWLERNLGSEAGRQRQRRTIEWVDAVSMYIVAGKMLQGRWCRRTRRERDV